MRIIEVKYKVIKRELCVTCNGADSNIIRGNQCLTGLTTMRAS